MSQSPFVANLHAQFESLEVTPCNMKNVKGFFINHKQIDAIEQEINAHLLDPKAGDVTETIEFKEEIDRLRESEFKLNREIQRVKADANAMAKALEIAQAEHDGMQHQLDIGKTSLETDRLSLLSKLEQAKEQLASAKAQGKTPQAKFDPEAALEYDTRLSEARLAVEVINKDLSRINQDKALLQKKYNTSVKDVKALKAKQHELMQQLTEANSIKASVSVKEFPKEAPKIQVKSELVKRLVGPKGLNWLQKAVDAEHANVRERVYNTMLAAKSGKTAVINDIFGLLEVVFKWVVNASFKARASITSWIDEVVRDFAAGTVQTAKAYRIKLEAIVGDLKETAGNTRRAAQEAYLESSARARSFIQVFLDEAYVWSHLVYNRSKRGFTKLRKSLGSFAQSISGWFSKRSSKTSEEDELLFELPILPIKLKSSD